MHNVYDASTGTCILSGVTSGQFDRWYDAHDHFRKVRDITEVNPMFRELYEATKDNQYAHWLVNCED